MEKQNLDALFKKAIDESANFYDDKARPAKERVWNQVKTKKKAIPLFYRMLAVASVLLLIFLSVSTYSNLQYKSTIDKLVETNKQLKADQQNYQNIDQSRLAALKQSIDTVFVEKKTAKAEPIVQTKFITDTIYIKEIVYIEKEKSIKPGFESEIVSNYNNDLNNDAAKPDQIASIPNDETNVIEKTALENSLVSNTIEESGDSHFQKNIIIESDNSMQKKKNRKFKIRFGRSNAKIGSEILALSTKISN